MVCLSFWRALLRVTGLKAVAEKQSAPTVTSSREERAAEQPSGLPVPTAVGSPAPLAPAPEADEDRGTSTPTAGMRAAALERTLRSLVELHGTEHPDTITARNNLATKYAQMGRRQSAVQQFEVALDEAVSVYGDEHPRTEIIRENLAWGLEDAGRPADAAQHWEMLLRERESQFGPADEDTVEARTRLAVCYRRSGRLDAAVAHYERAVEDVAGTVAREELRLGLSAALNMSGRYDEAITQLRMVLSGRRRRLGKGHLETLTVHHRLGRCYTQAGRANEAVETLSGAYRAAVNSSGDPEVRRLMLRLRRDLAGAYSAAGRPREADALL